MLKKISPKKDPRQKQAQENIALSIFLSSSFFETIHMYVHKHMHLSIFHFYIFSFSIEKHRIE